MLVGIGDSASNFEDCKPEPVPVEQTRICRRYKYFDLIGDLGFVKRRCVGFTTIFLKQGQQVFELTRRDVRSIRKRLNKRITCDFCRCFKNVIWPVKIFAKDKVHFYCEADEICRFRRSLLNWTSKRRPRPEY